MKHHKKLAFFDIDGTIYDGHSMLDQIKVQEKMGLLTKGTWNKIVLQIIWHKIRGSSYQQLSNLLLKIHANSLKGQNYQAVLDKTFYYLSKNKNKFFPYFGKFVKYFEKTHEIYLVTNNFQFSCEAVGKLFHINNYFSSIVEVKNGKFTGKLKLSLTGNKKIISDLVNKNNYKDSIAVGNSKNDIDMLEKVGLPFAIEPDKYLKTIAQTKGWKIVDRHTILDKLLALKFFNVNSKSSLDS